MSRPIGSKNGPKKKKQSHSVPEWMDEAVKKKARKLDVLERHELATRLENQAQQLREFSPPTPKLDCLVSLHVGKNAKAMLLAFYKAHCHPDEDKSEDIQLAIGARWFFESALADAERVSAVSFAQTSYCDREGLHQVTYAESLIGSALEKWQAKTKAEADKDDE